VPLPGAERGNDLFLLILFLFALFDFKSFLCYKFFRWAMENIAFARAKAEGAEIRKLRRSKKESELTFPRNISLFKD